MSNGIVNLAKQSDSTIIVLIVVIVFAIIALRPTIKMWIAAKDKQYQREIDQQNKKYQRETDQQNKLLEVIKNNTEVNVSLKTLLEEDRRFCNDCRKEQHRMFGQIQDNQDIANMKLVEIHTMLVKDK